MSKSKKDDSAQIASAISDIENAYRTNIDAIEKKYTDILKLRDDEIAKLSGDNDQLKSALTEVSQLLKVYKRQNSEKLTLLEKENAELSDKILTYEKIIKERKNMFNGKMKALTFSYDDSVTQDRRLIKLMNKYGIKCTFNVNSGLFKSSHASFISGVTVPHVRFSAEEIKGIYEGHEVAVHTVTHPFLNRLSDDEIIREVEDDRIALSELVGYDVIGMAYPMGTNAMNDHVASVIEKNTGVKYARTTTSTHNFKPQTELFKFDPTVHQHREMDDMFRLAKEFVEMKAETPQVFYIWGHAYEIDVRDDWDRLEEFFEYIGKRDDIFYGTNKEILL